MDRNDQILKLTKQLLPTGRAWWLPTGSNIRKFWYALGKSEATAYDFVKSILNQILPDNDEFTADDAALWENRLNLKVNPPGLTLDERKTLIARKYAFPGSFIYRQNWRFVEYQLQLAGFPCWIHENRFPDGGGFEYLYWYEITILQHSIYTQHGYQSQMGDPGMDLVANESDYPEPFEIGAQENYKGIFFVGGETFPDTFNVSEDLVTELRKLILTLKPANTVAVLLMTNYVEGEIELYDGNPWEFLAGGAVEFFFGS